LILERLVKDLIAEPAYANGDKSRLATATIEVNRDLREMSGKSAKESRVKKVRGEGTDIAGGDFHHSAWHQTGRG
jgi:hypothetical protein